MSSSQYQKAQASPDPKVGDLLRVREQTTDYTAQTAMDREIQKRIQDKGSAYRHNNSVVHNPELYLNWPAERGPNDRL